MKNVNNKENIAIFLPSMLIGGAETVAANLCNNLVEYYQVNLIVISGEISFQINPKVKVWKLYNYSISNAFIQKLSVPIVACKYAVLCNRLEVRTSLSFLPQANFINAFAKFYGVKYKVILSQRTNESAYLKMLNPVKRLVQKFFITTLYPKADVVNANSKHALIDLQQNFSLKNATSLIYNPLSPIPGITCYPSIMTDSAGKFKLLYVANFRKEKNHLMLLEAISLLPFKNQLKLFLIGSGDSTKEEAFIKNNNLMDIVELPGYVPKPFDYVAASDCCMLSSDFEGFSNSLLEALACGKPIISTATQGGVEMLHPDDTNINLESPFLAKYGILTQVGNARQMADAISLLFGNKTLQEHYAAAAKERAADFKTSTITEKFAELLAL